MTHLGSVFKIHILPPTSKNLSMQKNGCSKYQYEFSRFLSKSRCTQPTSSSNQPTYNVLNISQDFISGWDLEGHLPHHPSFLMSQPLKQSLAEKLPWTAVQTQMHAIPWKDSSGCQNHNTPSSKNLVIDSDSDFCSSSVF